MRIQLSIAVALMSAIAIPANLVAQIIETVPYATKKGLETIISELASTDAKGKQAKPDDFLDTRFVSQLEKEGFYKPASAR